jgi:signal transduction histidine kinase
MLTLGIGGDLNDRQQEFVEVINANVGRMGKLVGDLLEIARLEAGRIRLNLAPVSISQVMGEVLSSASHEIENRHHTLEQAIPSDLPPVWADRERLAQILTNLVRNAYMYTPEGGQIHIAAEILEGTDSVRMIVTDTGIGLSPTDLLRLRERFFRADHDLVRTQTGAGLGLSIVRGLVELQGGELSIESKPGQGSVFAFTLPLAQERAA